MKSNLFNELSLIEKSGKQSARKIATYLLGFDGDYKKLKIAQIANETFTSPASIVRMAKDIGYSGYPELKLELVKQSTAYLGTDNVLDESTIDSERHFNSVVNSFTDTMKLNSVGIIDAFIDDIINKKEINLYSMGETAVVAKDFHLKLVRIGISSTCFEDRHTQYFTSVNSNDETIAIGISYSAATVEVMDNLKRSHEAGAKVWLVCREGITKPEYVDQMLVVQANESIARVFSTTSRFSMMFLLDICYHQLINRDRDYYKNKLNETRIIRKKV